MKSILCLLLLFFTSYSTPFFAAETQSSKPTDVPASTVTNPTKTAPQATDQNQVKKEVTPYFNDEDEQDSEIKHVEETHFGELIVKMMLMLAITLTALYLVAWFTKRFLSNRMQGLNRSSRIQILEKRALSPKSLIYIIKVDEQEFVISEFPNGVQLLKEIPK